MIRDSVNNKLAECGSSEQMNNRGVKVLLEKHFGNNFIFMSS